MKTTRVENLFSNHPYRGAVDFQAILDLVRARPVERARDYPSLADLQELLQMPRIQAATRIWEAPGGRITGYALLNYAGTYADLAFEFLTGDAETSVEHAIHTLGDEMLAWGEQFYRQRYTGQAEELTSSARDEQPERMALLERHGFTRGPESVVEMFRSLCEPIAAPVLPVGFTIRPLNGEVEVRAWVKLHQVAFGTKNMTEESRLAMMRVPDYDPGLDLVAAAPDGTLAAYVFGAIHEEENALSGMKIGYPDSVGTHPDYQARGLARALLLECMARMKQRGMEAACLHTSSANTAMQRAAKAAGFQIAGQAWHYAKAIRR